MIPIDSHVIIDVLSEDGVWKVRPEEALADAADHDEIAINPIIYDDHGAAVDSP